LIEKLGDLPRIKYYEWEEILGTIYGKTMLGKEKCFFTDIDAVMAYMWRDTKQIVKEFSKNKGSYREVLIDTPAARAYSELKDFKLKWKEYQTKFLATDKPIASSNCLIDDTYYHIAYGQRLVAIEVYNPIFFLVQMTQFNTLWDSI
jgi:hypothetical protein